MKFQLYTRAALACDLPEFGLQSGDVVTIVDHHQGTDGSEGYSIEAFNAVGETVAVTAVAEAALKPLRANEVLTVRRLAAA